MSKFINEINNVYKKTDFLCMKKVPDNLPNTKTKCDIFFIFRT